MGVPILVGITGHRMIAAEARPAVEAAFERILDDLLRRFPRSRLAILSSLAVGADRIAARAALDRGLELFVPLPLGEEDYRTDFTEEEWTQFKELSSRASAVIRVHEMAGGEQGREIHYAAAGAFIVRYSQILVAFWDGRRVESFGGTCDVVDFALRGVPTPFSSLTERTPNPLERSVSIPVIHIRTPRPGQDGADAGKILVYERSTLGDEGPAPAEDAEILGPGIARLDWAGFQDSIRERHGALAKLEEFNEDLAGQKEITREKLERGACDILLGREEGESGEAERQRLLESRLGTHKTALMELLGWYTRANYLAEQARDRRTRLIKTMLGATMAAAFFLNFFFFIPGGTIAVYGYLFFNIATYLVYYYAKSTKSEAEYADYRALAECLRVQIFWKVSGIDRRVSEHFRSKHFTAVGWVSNVLSYLHLALFPHDGAGKNGAIDTAVSGPLWVRAQLEWLLRQKVGFFERRIRSQARISELIFWFTILNTLVLIARPTIEVMLHQSTDATALSFGVVQFLLGLTLAAGAVFNQYREKMAYKDLRSQYLKAAATFRAAAEGIDECEEILESLRSGKPLPPLAGKRAFYEQLREERSVHTRLKEILLSLGESALDENGNWIELFSTKEISRPQG